MADRQAPRFELDEERHATPAEQLALGPRVRAILKPLASLKLTVVLFALAIVIVFAGTLAQTQHDIWYVVDHYFRTGIAWIDLQVFCPKSFFPKMGPVPGSIPFPGGWLIGTVMAANLLAAHAVRFTYQAKGARLTTGLGVLGLGVLFTGLVVAGGSSSAVQGVPFFEWSTLWTLCKFTLAALSIGSALWATQIDRARVTEQRVLYGLSAALGAFVLWLFAKGDAVSLGDSSMRILWQLIQGTLAGGVLLTGCWLVFQKRAGIVLLHGGIGLMMFSELMVGTSAIESQMSVREGDSCNFVQDSRFVELAVIDRSDKDADTVVTVPQSRLDEGPMLLEHSWLPRWFIRFFPVSLRSSLGCSAGEVVVTDDKLPFDLKVVKYLQNSDVRPLKGGETNPATTGLGLEVLAVEVEKNVGASASNKVDESAIYVELLEKGTHKSLGTYLLNVLQARLQDSRERSGMSAAEVRAATGPFLVKMSAPAVVKLDDKPYELALRFKRYYKPYSMSLIDVHTEYYPGTTTPRDYSSTLQLVDPSRDVDRQVKVWMNNPLRFAGETFYQSTVGPDPITGIDTTGMQVVSNTGWMIPYVSCMIVGVGMLFQFGQTLLRFLRRRETASAAATQRPAPAIDVGLPQPADDDRSPSLWNWLFPAIVVALCAVGVLRQARPPGAAADQVDLYAAGKLPLLDHGRAKPFDTLARNTLKVISHKETFYGPMDDAQLKARWPKIEKQIVKQWPELAGPDVTSLLAPFAGKPEKFDKLVKLLADKTHASPQEVEDFLYKATAARQPATRWLLDVIARRELAKSHRVFRIDNFEVLDMLGLSRREGFLYSLLEIGSREKKFYEEVEKAHKKPVGDLSVYERKLLDLDRRIRSFTPVEVAFRRREFSDLKPDEIREMVKSRRSQLMAQLDAEDKKIESGNPPLVVPVRVETSGKSTYEWKPLISAWTRDFFEAHVLTERPADPAVAAWNAILTAYGDGKPAEFNKAVDDYQALMADEAPPDLNARKTAYEAFFNSFAPFFQAWLLYIAVFVLAVLGWLFSSWRLPLQRAAFWLTLFTLGLHTFALASRIYISGRPPVTNLYSSAVFIGWGCVGLGLVLEAIYRLGIGNAIAAIAGFATLFISFTLSGDGDTFTVMQAVLDTQFWLATHVTCITMGYATTYLSGLLGAFYIVRGILKPTLSSDIGKSLARMVYGTLCFALFFSFVGTVLGGLWADDSWGRFWGWDPKENGALIIVLWNALVLHARWDGMVKDRGLCVLAVGGSIVTSWSWFGVNELGVGLHSYGFTEGVLFALGCFVASQLVLIGIGARPRSLWWSQESLS